MRPAIAIVGMACEFSDAKSPQELWENVLAQRQAFRRIPSERLNLEDYWSGDRNAPDLTYACNAALIEGYEFDRVKFRVAGPTFRSADLVHWLALDVAERALVDAGFVGGAGLPGETTGVLLGNTLTGEFSRANVLRLRWPYVRRVLEAQFEKAEWTLEQRQAFLQDLETEYKAPFPAIGEETLAGNLSNTIAGRICNHFDLKGGGYTLDGACSSSLLAVANACAALTIGDLDVALAGGVDLSIDPFELVGFARAGALAPNEMRVYDARSEGFWPGEGCGFVVLMRHEDAIAQNRRVYAVVRGWGISSDGSGGMTRPEMEGQGLALRRAYHRAGFGIESVGYFEGHGTGTSVGDATELKTLSEARREAEVTVPLAAIGSIKANIGHTKAAAGIAGLIKATMALQAQVLPPITGCEQPHPELVGERPALRVLKGEELWPTDVPLRAGVSGMGFGGINAHLVLESVATQRRQSLTPDEKRLIASAQDAEVFLLAAEDAVGLQEQVKYLLAIAPKLSRSELTDLAAQLARTLSFHPVRAAITATTPTELTKGLETLRVWLEKGIKSQLDLQAGVFLGVGRSQPKIGFLFPGQASPSYLNAGAWGRRFGSVRDLYEWANLPQDGDGKSTDVAQPAIVTASMAELRLLDHLGIVADVAVGHSLGELAALHWSGVWDEATLLRIATERGRAMSQLGKATGAMASIHANSAEVKALINGDRAVVAGLNSPLQTIISGEATDIATVVGRAQTKGLKAFSLPVSHAFHSPLVAAAVQPLADCLEQECFQPLGRTVVSTVSGSMLSEQDDLRSLLCRQVTVPVRFIEAITQAAKDADLLIEVGPGRVLSGLALDCVDVPVVSLDAGGASLRGLLNAFGAAFALGAPVNQGALFSDRFSRPFNLNWQPRFFVNPCELAPKINRRKDFNLVPGQESFPSSNLEPIENGATTDTPSVLVPEELSAVCLSDSVSPLALVRQLVAMRTELPLTAVQDEHRLLSDLHLNSITVSQLVVEASHSLGLAPPVAPTHYADATVAGVAQALEELLKLGGAANSEREVGQPAGVDAWVRTFTVEWVERSRPRHRVSQDVKTDVHWQVFAPFDYPLAEALQAGLEALQGSGVMVCLPPVNVDDASAAEVINRLLQGARAVQVEPKDARFVLVQHGYSSASFARTLHLEVPSLTNCVVDVPIAHPQAVEWILAEVQAAMGYSEAHYDADGKRYEPVLRLLPMPEPTEIPLSVDDVLLVTGGGKGIAAECAIALAQETGVRLAILGRSQPEADAELGTNLARMAAKGVQVQYVAADMTEAEAVQEAISKIEVALGPVTAILHGAGVNVPKLVSALEEDDFQRTLAPKVQGIRNLLGAVNPKQLKLLVTFGSIIARTGLPGEADYAIANEWLAHSVEQFQKDYPACRCLNIEWSIWSGVGMGERLGRIDILMQQGITPITPDIGIESLRRLLTQSLPSSSVVVTGRFGDPPTLKVEQPDLPFLRFLEKPRVYYPGVELIVDVELSLESDPYLKDHVFQGEHIFPAVMGLEAMAQVAMALAETTEIPIFEEVKFHQSIVVSEGNSLKIRVVTLIDELDRINVVIRSEQTSFLVNHFEAICYFGKSKVGIGNLSLSFPDPQNYLTPISLNPKEDLYGDLLFHGERFQRLRSYRKLRSRECLAEITLDSNVQWFSRYLPGDLVLGDAAGRDAAIHALQACIPHATILPIGVERFIPGVLQARDGCFVYGQERPQDGDRFIYDVEVIGIDGYVMERWEGLQLQVIQHRDTEAPWVATLLGPYIERKLRELMPGTDIGVVVDQDSMVERRIRSDRAIQQAIGKTNPVWRRPDGKPEILGDLNLSVAHTGSLTIVIAESIGCDIEVVVSRTSEIWQKLSGSEQFLLAKRIAEENSEDLNISSTRVWCAIECLRKAGSTLDVPLLYTGSIINKWLTLIAGDFAVATLTLSILSTSQILVLALIVEAKVHSFNYVFNKN
jgi:enediyne polyketide synthase